MHQRRSESIRIPRAAVRRAVRRPPLGLERLESRGLLSASLGELPADYLECQLPAHSSDAPGFVQPIAMFGAVFNCDIIMTTHLTPSESHCLPTYENHREKLIILNGPVCSPDENGMPNILAGADDHFTHNPQSEQVPGSVTSPDYFSEWRHPIASINYILTTPTGEITGLILVVNVYEGEDLSQRVAAGLDLPHSLSGRFVVNQVIVEYWKTIKGGGEWAYEWSVREGVEVLSPGAAPSGTALLESWPSSVFDWHNPDVYDGPSLDWLTVDLQDVDFQFPSFLTSMERSWYEQLLGLAWPGPNSIEADLADADDTPEACEANVSQSLDDDSVIGGQAFAGLPGAVEVGAAAPAEPAPRSPVAKCFAALAGLEPLLSDTVGVPTLRSDSTGR